MNIDDATLHAWFDGELTPAQAATVEARVRDDPELAVRVRQWGADRDALRAELDPMLLEPVPQRLERALWPSPSRRSAGLWAAGVALFVLGGAAGGVLMSSLPGRPPALQASTGEWLQRAAVAHAVYVPEKRHPVEVSAEQNQDGHLARWLTKRLDVPVKLFDLAPQGFDLVGGRLLPDERGPSAQLMYQNAAGQRVTVYIRKSDVGSPDPARAAFRYERQGDLGIFYWVDGQGADAAGCAIVGNLPREQLLALAKTIYEQGEAAPTKAGGS